MVLQLQVFHKQLYSFDTTSIGCYIYRCSAYRWQFSTQGARKVTVIQKGIKITALICVLNEEKNLPYVLPKIPDWIDEVLLVDGHSVDKTIDVARSLRPGIRVLTQPGRGKGDALKYGFQNAKGDIIVTLDADGNTDPNDLPKFIDALLAGNDFAKGSRFLEGYPPKMPMHRRLGNWVLVTTSNVLFRTHYTDICSGYNGFWKKSFEKVKLVNDGFEMEQEMNVKIRKAGLKIIEISCQDKGRLGGQSKVSTFKQGWKDLMIIIGERFHA